jgi:hypothetical protein
MSRFVEFATLNKFIQFRGALVLEREIAAQHGIEHDPTAPNIDLEGRIRLLGEHFGGSVARTATSRGELFILLVEVAESEIDELDGVVLADEDVLGFEVAMCNSQGVQILDCVEQLLEIFTGRLLVQSTPKLALTYILLFTIN